MPAADDRRGERFRDVALCKLADAKRRVWGLRERCRLAKTLRNRPSITTAFGADQKLASRRKTRSLNHLAELLTVMAEACNGWPFALILRQQKQL